MPWSVVTEHEDCDGYAVIKDDEPGNVVGCHESQFAAEKQVAALYASESEENMEATKVEIRTAEIEAAADGRSFEGYAAVWNSPSLQLPFTETIKRGAFDKTLRSRNNVMLLHAHNPELILATTRARTLRLEEDGHGLRVQADLPDTTWGNDVAELVKRGDLGHMSFGFSVPPGGDTWSEDGNNRELSEVRLHEVSTVGNPAYPATSTAVRALDCPECIEDRNSWTSLMERFANNEPLSVEEVDQLIKVATELRVGEPAAVIPASIARMQLELKARL